jgi:hypothetical protein
MSPNIDGLYGSQRFLKAQDLPNGRYVKLVIDRVEVERLRSEGRSEGDKLVVYFVGKQKGFVLNSTNANRIAELTHSKETDDWAGWTIQLYQTMVEFQGKRVPALRVNDQPGSAMPPRKARPVGRAQAKPAQPPPESWDIDEAESYGDDLLPEEPPSDPDEPAF